MNKGPRLPRKKRCPSEEGLSTLDVLAAITLGGLAFAVLFQLAVQSYALMSDARLRTAALRVASQKVVESEMGVERLRSGVVRVKEHGEPLQWRQSVGRSGQSGAVPCEVEVTWRAQAGQTARVAIPYGMGLAEDCR